MIGIYKITSPIKKVYVGQSINVEKRIYQYKKLHCKSQVKLYESFIKYGVENHLFEILEECNIELLNERERHYQDLYYALENGLNCRLTTSKCKSGFLSNETKMKMSKFQKGKKVSLNTIQNMINSHKNISQETRLKMSISRRKRITKDETRLKISNSVSKLVLDTQNGIFYNSINEASYLLKINRNTLSGYLNGKRKNQTNLIKI